MERALDASRDERERIAASLHDGVVQQLAAASFTAAGAAELAAGTGDAAQAQRLRDVAATVRGSIAAVRSLLVDIYPPSLRDAGLDAALRDLVGVTAARAPGVELHLAVDAATANGLPAEVQEAVFRVAQEALRNAVDHARASRIALSLGTSEGRPRLDVEDDGAGFDATAPAAADGHLGMRLMSDVALSIGARLSVLSSPQRGTLVRMELFPAVDV
jgi:signal transduction histidine kinase